MNPAFFDAVRPIFGGTLTQGQVEGLNADLGAWAKYGDGDDRKLAYILSTDKLESAATMQAVKETYNRKYDGDTQPDDAKVKRRLDDALKKGRIKRNYWKDGWFGRGKPQVTHKENYEKVGKLVGKDFVSNPDGLLDLTVSSEVMVRAMLAGTFTGAKLGDYINAKGTDYINARKVVNGLDRARDIADDAVAFERALVLARQSPVQPERPPVGTPIPDRPSLPPTGHPAGLGGVIAIIVAALLAIGGAILAFFNGAPTP